MGFRLKENNLGENGQRLGRLTRQSLKSWRAVIDFAPDSQSIAVVSRLVILEEEEKKQFHFTTQASRRACCRLTARRVLVLA